MLKVYNNMVKSGQIFLIFDIKFCWLGVAIFDLVHNA